MLTKQLPIAIYFLISSFNLFSQSYQITISNPELSGKNKYEFDILIKSTSGEFELTSYQVSLKYYIDRDHLNFYYVNGSSDLNSVPVVGIGILGNGEDSLLTFASLPGTDTITENEINIGRFVISSNESLTGEEIRLFWNFSGDAVTMLTGSGFSNFTDPANHFPKNNHFTFGKSEVNDAGTETIFPPKFELLQNYPNPLNPSTTIKYAVQSESFIQIKVYNILGEEVRNLVDQYQSPGVYEIKFNAESLPSGYYVYSLFSNEKIIDNKKMILLK
jgi:hypothetical protein